MLAVVVVLALGDWSRTRGRYAAAIEENARLQEAEREDRSRRAVDDERERIARELHDIVTHHVSVIVIQAGAGLTALDRRPEGARSALEAIDRTGREALTDMRRMLGILGAPRDAENGTADDTTREPMPGLERLGRLIEEVRAAGLPVELSWRANVHLSMPASSCPPTGSSRRRSPTRSSTPAALVPACASPTSRGPSTSK